MGGIISNTKLPVKKDGTKMSEQNIQDVINSWAEVKKYGPEAIGIQMFQRLFVRAPETFLMFPDFRALDNYQDSEVFKHHCKIVMNMIGSAVGLLKDPDSFASSLHYLGLKHHGMLISKRHFDILGEELNNVLLECLGPEKYTPEVSAAWVNMYKVMAEKIINVMNTKPNY